ncbi:MULTISPECIES: cytochrome P450 family protein [Streptomyces]|uniref:cytochrome P450 family protein n=1 Tax=Streptomyces TaxID=1883 RepID=UPI002079F517|nr:MULTISPECIES: cytochrome P450 [Streptomyces]MCM9076923.1 cytochrome P450 [Streptomyces spororaveus]MCX5308426.1 cytochrome P450 [Streptomyces sp. NBC_00160]
MALVDLSTHADAFNADPYPFYDALRTAGPVHRLVLGGERTWLVVGHEEARQALTHPGLSKNWFGSEPFANGTPVQAVATSMLDSDPPRHTRLRRLVARAFTARRVESLRPRVQQITDELLDAMAARPDRRADLIAAFAAPLPMTVICELLGVPGLDRQRFRSWSGEIVAPLNGVGADPRAVEEMTAYLLELVAAKAEDPGEDLLSALIRTRDEDGGRLSPDELIGMAFLLLVAGHETTVNLIGNGVRALLAHPDQLAALRADPDALIDGAVEEMLRYDGPVQHATYRFAATDLELGGVSIEAGSSVLVALAAADRDPARFAHPGPDVFDIRRTGPGHLAFGHGIHFCLGAPLARMEARIAVRALLDRFPDLAEAPDAGPPDWLPGSLMRGVTRLPLQW